VYVCAGVAARSAAIAALSVAIGGALEWQQKGSQVVIDASKKVTGVIDGSK